MKKIGLKLKTEKLSINYKFKWIKVKWMKTFLH